MSPVQQASLKYGKAYILQIEILHICCNLFLCLFLCYNIFFDVKIMIFYVGIYIYTYIYIYIYIYIYLFIIIIFICKYDLNWSNILISFLSAVTYRPKSACFYI